MHERPEEARARRIIEEALGVKLRYADFAGGVVDYLFDADLFTAAVEVTRVTSPNAKRGADAWMKARAGAAPTKLTRSWKVVVNDQVIHKGLHAQLEPILGALERMSIHRAHSLAELPLAALEEMNQLRELQVEGLISRPPASQQEPMIFVAPLIGYSSEGSAEALTGIEAELNARVDNVRKLREAGVGQRQLFVWLDLDTPGSIRRPLESPPGELGEHFGLPSRSPAIDPAVDVLWIVHDLTGFGWRWSRQGGWVHLRTSDDHVPGD